MAGDDEDVQLKYADVLLKGLKNLGRQELAAQIYDRLLARSSWYVPTSVVGWRM